MTMGDSKKVSLVIFVLFYSLHKFPPPSFQAIHSPESYITHITR